MRLSVIKVFFVVFFLLISLRLFYWQVVKADFLQAQAEDQHSTSIKVTASRGDIFFSDETLMVSTNPSYSLYGLPKSIEKEKRVETAYRLARAILGDVKEKEVEEEAKFFIDKFSEDLYWVSLKKNISVDLKKKIEDLKIPGVGFEQSSQRFYPEGSSAAHLLGFVGSDAKGADKGYFGIEGYYEGELRGSSGLQRFEKDALGLPILIGNFLTQQANDGKDLVLNIDRSVQFIVENALKKGMNKYGAKSGSVVIMEPRSGAVLAMAAYPSYNPAKFSEFPKEDYKNPVVATQYEPGSTFKVLVMASAINEDLVKPDTKCDICAEPISIGGFTIRTWNNKYYKDATLKDVIVHSDNTGMVFTAQKLGLDKFYGYIKNFGFGEATKIDLQDEFSPEIRDKKTWREIDLATASFGQGIAVTPIQMVRAVSAIANGGFLMEPHIVKQIRDQGRIFEVKPKVVRQVIKESSAKAVTEMMVAAVDEGESKWAKPKGFKVAGKTGTAQIPVAGHYDPNKTIASFVGFAPANDPKFVMLVRYDQPTSSIYGSETAAPTFFEIAKDLFTYYKIAPSE